MIEFDESASYPAEPLPHYTNPHDGKALWGFGGFTKRERACIDLLHPDSGLGWLDVMIRARKRDEMARAAMQSLINSGDSISLNTLCEFAHEMADAMILESQRADK